MTVICLHSSTKSTLSASALRIPRAAFEALRSVDTLLRDAETLARSIERDARLRAEEVRAAAYQQGQAEGREAALVAILGTVQVEQRMLGLLGERIGHVVEQCLRSLVGQADANELFGARIAHAVRSIATDGAVTLHVAPAQAHLAKEALRTLEQQSGVDLKWLSLHVDEGCPEGDFVIETAVGFVDARVQTTLDHARRIIEQAVVRAGQEVRA